MHVKEILDRTPPPLLYHYTTQHGLLGIIKSKEMWATHTQYLNDVREFLHAVDMVKQELTGMIAEPPMGGDMAFLRRLQENLALQVESINVCVCSFSSEGDSLPQWRAYGGSASGFAMGFSGDYLRKVCGEVGWLVPVLYQEDQQRELVRTLLEDVVAEHRSDPDSDVPENNFFAYLYRYAPILKHRSFAEEREWRIITTPRLVIEGGFDYRAGVSTLIPFFRLPLGEAKSLGIEEIVVGPTPHPNQSFRAVRGLLMKHDIRVGDTLLGKGVNIRHSDVPYRNW